MKLICRPTCPNEHTNVSFLVAHVDAALAARLLTVHDQFVTFLDAALPKVRFSPDDDRTCRSGWACLNLHDHRIHLDVFETVPEALEEALDELDEHNQWLQLDDSVDVEGEGWGEVRSECHGVKLFEGGDFYFNATCKHSSDEWEGPGMSPDQLKQLAAGQCPFPPLILPLPAGEGRGEGEKPVTA